VSIEEHVKTDAKKMRSLSEPTQNDGLFLMLAKRVCMPYVAWHSGGLSWVLKKLAPLAKRWIPSKAHTNIPSVDDPCLFRLCVDIYVVAVFLILCLSYFSVYVFVISERCFCSAAAVSVAVAFCLFRAYEILAFLTLLHSKPNYKSPALIRSLLNTIWHYLEIAIAFSVFYLACTYFLGDKFAADSSCSNIETGFWNAIYYSFVTIATIGFGDFSPQTQIGRILVIGESITGLFLLVIVLQRSMSAGPEKSFEEALAVLEPADLSFAKTIKSMEFFHRESLPNWNTQTVQMHLKGLKDVGFLYIDYDFKQQLYAFHWTDLGNILRSKF
jgi:hypothetical protein